MHLRHYDSLWSIMIHYHEYHLLALLIMHLRQIRVAERLRRRRARARVKHDHTAQHLDRFWLDAVAEESVERGRRRRR